MQNGMIGFECSLAFIERLVWNCVVNIRRGRIAGTYTT